MAVFAQNKKARFDYEILETFQAGIVLIGTEVKAIKTGHISIKGSYVVIKDNEFFLIGANIPPYQPKNAPKDYEPERLRKLLLTKSEIKHLVGKIKQKGLTLVPLKVYSVKGKIKILFGIGKGKKKFDKRETIKKREFDREKSRWLQNSFVAKF